MQKVSFVITMAADQAVDIANSVSEVGLSGSGITKQQLAISLQAVLSELLQEYLPEDDVIIEIRPV